MFEPSCQRNQKEEFMSQPSRRITITFGPSCQRNRRDDFMSETYRMHLEIIFNEIWTLFRSILSPAEKHQLQIHLGAKSHILCLTLERNAILALFCLFYDVFLKVRARSTVIYNRNESTAKCRDWVTFQGPFTNSVRTPSDKSVCGA